MPPKKSNLNNASSREARRKRVKRAHQSAEQIAAQILMIAEGRAHESQEQFARVMSKQQILMQTVSQVEEFNQDEDIKPVIQEFIDMDGKILDENDHDSLETNKVMSKQHFLMQTVSQVEEINQDEDIKPVIQEFIDMDGKILGENDHDFLETKLMQLPSNIDYPEERNEQSSKLYQMEDVATIKEEFLHEDDNIWNRNDPACLESKPKDDGTVKKAPKTNAQRQKEYKERLKKKKKEEKEKSRKLTFEEIENEKRKKRERNAQAQRECREKRQMEDQQKTFEEIENEKRKKRERNAQAQRECRERKKRQMEDQQKTFEEIENEIKKKRERNAQAQREFRERLKKRKMEDKQKTLMQLPANIDYPEERNEQSNKLYQMEDVETIIKEEFIHEDNNIWNRNDPAFLESKPSICQNASIHVEHGEMESEKSIESSLCNYVKIEPSDETSVLYEPTDIVAGNYIAEQVTNGDGATCSLEDTKSCSFSHHVKEEDSITSFNEDEKSLSTSAKERQLQGKNNPINDQVFDETDSASIIPEKNAEKTLDCSGGKRCQSCKFVSSAENILEMHIETMDSSSNNFKCHLCDFVCDLNVNLKNHISEVHLKLHEFHCRMHNYRSRPQKGYRTVMSKGQPKYECNDCDYNSQIKGQAEAHVKTEHPRLKKFMCLYCNFITTLYGNWKIHMDCVHLKVKNFKCRYCDCSFGLKQTLERHIESVHQNKREHKCDICDYRACTKGVLHMHTKCVHNKTNKDRKFSCTICDKNFVTKRSLQLHADYIHVNVNTT